MPWDCSISVMSWSLTTGALVAFGSFALTLGTGAQAWADVTKFAEADRETFWGLRCSRIRLEDGV